MFEITMLDNMIFFASECITLGYDYLYLYLYLRLVFERVGVDKECCGSQKFLKGIGIPLRYEGVNLGNYGEKIYQEDLGTNICIISIKTLEEEKYVLYVLEFPDRS